jgi:hypothetical protein
MGILYCNFVKIFHTATKIGSEFALVMHKILEVPDHY